MTKSQSVIIAIAVLIVGLMLGALANETELRSYSYSGSMDLLRENGEVLIDKNNGYLQYSPNNGFFDEDELDCLAKMSQVYVIFLSNSK